MIYDNNSYLLKAFNFLEISKLENRSFQKGLLYLKILKLKMLVQELK